MDPTRVTCIPTGWELDLAPGETVLEAALRMHRPLASSCGGKAVCGDCRVRIVDGAEHAGVPDREESAWRVRSGHEGPERLACCLRPTGPIAVTTHYW